MKAIFIEVLHFFYNLWAAKPVRSISLSRDPGQALKTFFDAVWVLTIPRNTGRQESIRRLFEGLPFTFYTGVDGRTLKEDGAVDLVEAQRIQKRSMGINELACTYSHVKMYEKIVAEKLDRVLIFEDDAIVSRRRLARLPGLLESLPEKWDLVYFGYRDGELRGFLWELLEALGLRKRDSSQVVSRTVWQGLRTAAGHDFTHAYAVSYEGAKKLLEGVYPIRFTADGLLEDKILGGKLQAYISIPKIFFQTASLPSTIHSKS